jgi:hypothetical protein
MCLYGNIATLFQMDNKELKGSKVGSGRDQTLQKD